MNKLQKVLTTGIAFAKYPKRLYRGMKIRYALDNSRLRTFIVEEMYGKSNLYSIVDYGYNNQLIDKVSDIPKEVIVQLRFMAMRKNNGNPIRDDMSDRRRVELTMPYFKSLKISVNIFGVESQLYYAPVSQAPSREIWFETVSDVRMDYFQKAYDSGKFNNVSIDYTNLKEYSVCKDEGTNTIFFEKGNNKRYDDYWYNPVEITAYASVMKRKFGIDIFCKDSKILLPMANFNHRALIKLILCRLIDDYNETEIEKNEESNTVPQR